MNTTWKSKVKSLSVIFAASAFIAACGQASSSSSSSSSTSSGDKNETVTATISMRTNAIPYVENHADINKDEYVKKIAEYTGVALDFTLQPHTEFSTKMDLMFASSDIPDIVQTQNTYQNGSNGSSIKLALEAGIFQPLDDLIDEYGPNLKKYIPEEVWDKVRGEDGKIYAIPQMLSNPARRATWIRKDLLDQTGLDVPETVEEALDVLRAFKELGIKQPYIARERLSYSDTFFGAYDVLPLWELDENGKPVPKYFDAGNMKQAIQVYKTMYEEGLISPEFLTQDSNQGINAIIAGDAGMWSMNANKYVEWATKLRQNNPDAELVLIPSPVGPEGDSGYALYTNVSRSYMINKDAKHPEKIIQMFDWMVTEEAEEFFTYGIEGLDHTVENGEIKYEMTTEADDVNREVFRTNWLWMVHDDTYVEGLLEQTEDGKYLLEAYNEVLAHEGISNVSYFPELETYASYPNLLDKGLSYSNFLMERIAKMITGGENIENWDTVIEDWKKAGGNLLLDEAADRVEKGQYEDTKR